MSWKSWKEVDGNDKRIKFKYGEKIVNGDIYRFKNHLASTRIHVEPCSDVPQEVKATINYYHFYEF